MPRCPSCQAEILEGSRFCEACGHRMEGDPPVASDNGGTSRPPTHGSLRKEIPLLSGPARRIRARIDTLQERAERERHTSRRENAFRQREKQAVQEQHRRGKGRGFAGILLGVLVLVLWVYLLVRLRPSPTLGWQILERLLGSEP